MYDTVNGAWGGGRKLRAVGFQIVAYDVHLCLGLARMFKQRMGSRVYIYVSSPEEKRGLERQNRDGLIDEFIVSQIVTPALSLPVVDEAEAVAKARAWEARIGETYNRLAFEHRHLSRGYFAGGGGNPRSPRVTRASYAQMLNALNAAMAFWENEVRTKQIDLLIGAEKAAIGICRALNIPYRRLFLSKFGAEHFWAIDEKATNFDIERIYHELTEWPPVELSTTHLSQIKKVQRTLRNIQVKTIVSQLATGLTKGLFLMAFGSHRGRISLRDLLTVPFQARRNFAAYNSLIGTSLEELKGKPFVYFPLHKEPETNMLAASPEYFNQINAIISLSRDLPAGVPLVLKEHIPAFALRAPGFYRNLLDLKNVRLIDVFESSIEIIRHASATVTITGAAGLEAAVLGRPVVQFGRHMTNRFLPHVMTVTDEKQIAVYLRRAINGEIDSERAKADGARFREALRRASFHMPDFMVAEDEIAPESVENAYNALLNSLEQMPAVGAP